MLESGFKFLKIIIIHHCTVIFSHLLPCSWSGTMYYPAYSECKHYCSCILLYCFEYRLAGFGICKGILKGG